MATHSSPYDWADTDFARRSFLTANAVALGSTVSDLPARFRLPRAADAGTEPDVLGNSLANRNDVIFTDTSGTVLKWEFTHLVNGVGFLKWPTLTSGAKTDQLVCYYDYAGASSQQSSGSDIYGASYEGWWAFDEGTGVGASAVSDRSGNARHGTPTNMEEGDWVSGPLVDDGALSMDGSDEWVNVAHAAALNPGVGDWSLQAMVKTSSASTQAIITKTDTPEFYMLNVQADGTLRFLIDDGSAGNWLVTSANSIADGEWHHVAGVVDRDTSISVYVDGVAVTDTSVVHEGSIDGTTDLQFGERSDVAGWNFDGEIALTSVCGAVVSAAEIAAHNLSLRNQLYTWGPEETQ